MPRTRSPKPIAPRTRKAALPELEMRTVFHAPVSPAAYASARQRWDVASCPHDSIKKRCGDRAVFKNSKCTARVSSLMNEDAAARWEIQWHPTGHTATRTEK